MKSSAIATLEYDESTGITTCVFHGGNTYTWNNIPKSIFDEWYDSFSWGKFFNEFIKDKYD